MNKPQTRFARGTLQNGANINSSPKGKKEESLRFGAQLMESLKRTQLSPDVSTVLTTCGAYIGIKIQSNGTATFEMVSHSGMVPLADERDLRAISGLNMAINEERKLAQKETLTKDVIAQCAAIKAALMEKDKSFQSLPKGFVDVVKTMMSTINALALSMQSIDKLSFVEDSAEQALKAMFQEFGTRIQAALANYLLHRGGLKDHEEAKKVNFFLRQVKCPEYIFKRLTDKTFVNQGTDFDIRHVLFPNDPAKGFYLTVREIFEAEMHKYCFDLCSADLINNGILDREVLDVLLRLSPADKEGFTKWDEVKSLGSKIAGIPIFYPAPAKYVDQMGFYNFLAKNGKRGIAFKAGSSLSPQDFLKFFGTVAKKVAYLTMPMVQYWSEFTGVAFPGFEFDPSKEGKDFFVQLKEWSIQPDNKESRKIVFAMQETKTFRLFRGQLGQYKDIIEAMKVQGRAMLLIMGIDTTSDYANLFYELYGLGIEREDYMEKYQVDQKDEKGETILDKDGAVLKRNMERQVHFSQVMPITDKIVAPRAFGVTNTMVPIALLATSYDTKHALGILGDDAKTISKVKEEKEDKRSGLVERIGLSPAAQVVVASLKERRKPSLAARMDSWFRLFMSPVVQNAVAGMVNARLEVLFGAPIVYNSVDKRIFFEGLLAQDDHIDPFDEGPDEDGTADADLEIEDE